MNVIEFGEIDLHTPLRRHGALRAEPAALPWGISCDIGLNSVDYQERSLFVQGGLRAGYTQHADDAAIQSILSCRRVCRKSFATKAPAIVGRIFVGKESISPQ